MSESNITINLQVKKVLIKQGDAVEEGAILVEMEWTGVVKLLWSDMLSNCNAVVNLWLSKICVIAPSLKSVKIFSWKAVF